MSEKQEDRAFQLECIEVYKSLPALWKVKCNDYRNRQKKDVAYTVLVEKFQEKYQNYTREDVKKKINAYRTNYRKELKKVIDSERSGTDQVYEPTLWYFNSLTFLNEQDIPAKSWSSLDDESWIELTTDDCGPSQEDDREDAKTCIPTDMFEEPQSPLTSSSGMIKDPLQNSAKRIKLRSSVNSVTVDALEELLQLASERFREGREDVNLCQAKTWAVELSKMTPDQQLFAKKAINDILFEGQMGTLRRNSVKINDDNWIYIDPQNNGQNIFQKPTAPN